MAHKSKTQRAKAAVAKANRKERAEREEAASGNAALSQESTEAKKAVKQEASASKPQVSAVAKKEDKKPKKTRFQFFKDVRAELKRVTWPTRTDVLRWSGVVVGALVFFGVYVAVLDNVIITPALVALSGLGA